MNELQQIISTLTQTRDKLADLWSRYYIELKDNRDQLSNAIQDIQSAINELSK